MLLSYRNYFLYSKQVEKLRNNFMANRRLNIISKENWYDLLAKKPILVCGASLSNIEWDIWLAIVSLARLRNKNKYPIFKMHGLEDNNLVPKSGINFFYPITKNRLCFSEEWQIIIDAFNK